MNRKVPAEVQKVFDKYTVNFVRRLPKDKAMNMFKEEFGLDEERSELMFEMFDKDRNGILSAWEFYLYYECMGYKTNEHLDRFKKLEKDGCADPEGTFDFLKELKTLSGRNFSDEEVETCMKGIIGEDRTITQQKFVELISRIRMTRN